MTDRTERAFILRLTQDAGVELSEDDLGHALSAAEDAANESLIEDGFRFKIGPEVRAYTRVDA